VGCGLHAGEGAGVVAGEVESVADDALDAFAGVDVFLDGDLVSSSLLEEAAYTNIEAFGVFAEDHEIDVGGAAIAERGEALVEELGGAGVNVEVELEAEAEEDVGGVLVGGDAWVAEGSKEDGVEFIAKHFHRARGEGDFLAKIFVGAPVEVDEFDGAIAFGGGGLDDLNGDGSDFLADAVAGDDRDARFWTTIAERNVGHEDSSVGRSEVRANLAQVARGWRVGEDTWCRMDRRPANGLDWYFGTCNGRREEER
jgi:hypothetical protein